MRVSGTIDRPRRRLHMALHTAQHMLSRALVDIAGAETVSSRLGETECTIDVDKTSIEERDLARAEDLVNGVIEDDLAIRAFFPSASELATLPLRRAPKVTENVRVVDIGGFDVSPCGGTHCTRTAQVGLLRVFGIERYKGKLRVKFAAGRRARAELAKQDDVLRAVARDLTCGPSDVPGALGKLRRELDVAREQAKRAAERLAESVANELWAAATARVETRVVASFEGMPAPFLRALGARITQAPDAVALLASRGEDGTSVLCARGSASTFDCGAFLKRAAAQAGGRGGGRAESAEGRLPVEADWAALCASA
jgi:alanyl-tRNA synthetase